LRRASGPPLRRAVSLSNAFDLSAAAAAAGRSDKSSVRKSRPEFPPITASALPTSPLVRGPASRGVADAGCRSRAERRYAPASVRPASLCHAAGRERPTGPSDPSLLKRALPLFLNLVRDRERESVLLNARVEDLVVEEGGRLLARGRGGNGAVGGYRRRSRRGRSQPGADTGGPLCVVAVRREPTGRRRRRRRRPRTALARSRRKGDKRTGPGHAAGTGGRPRPALPLRCREPRPARSQLLAAMSSRPTSTSRLVATRSSST
jgi:hypothetical protein